MGWIPTCEKNLEAITPKLWPVEGEQISRTDTQTDKRDQPTYLAKLKISPSNNSRYVELHIKTSGMVLLKLKLPGPNTVWSTVFKLSHFKALTWEGNRRWKMWRVSLQNDWLLYDAIRWSKFVFNIFLMQRFAHSGDTNIIHMCPAMAKIWPFGNDHILRFHWKFLIINKWVFSRFSRSVSQKCAALLLSIQFCQHNWECVS